VGAKGRVPLVDFCHRNGMRAQPARCLNPAHRLRGRPRIQHFDAAPLRLRHQTGGNVPCEDGASRDFMGQGPARRFSQRAFGISRRNRSRRKLCPNPIGSDISCRKLVTIWVWKNPHRRTHRDVPLTNSPDGLAFRHRPSCRAASYVPPRRGARSAAPEMPSIVESPPEGLVAPPQAVPSLWTNVLAPVRSPVPLSCFDSAKHSVDSNHHVARPAR
jgi:hypothetical protein